MFDQLRLRNFRAIQDSRLLELSRLNVLIGPNNAGKSSLLYALLLLRQTFADKDPRAVLVTDLPGLDLGGYPDLVTGNDLKRHIGIAFGLRKDSLPKITVAGLSSSEVTGCRFSVEFGFDSADNRISVRRSTVSNTNGDEILGVAQKGKRLSMSGAAADVRDHLRPALVHFVPTLGLGRPPSQRKKTQKAFAAFLDSHKHQALVEDALSRIRYIGPVRERIMRFGVRGAQAYSEVGPTGAEVLRVLASGEKIGSKKSTAVGHLSDALRDTFNLLEDVKILDLDARRTLMALVANELRGGSENMNLAQMGFGIGQLVPVIVQTALLPPGGCLLVEQPEIHLHPRAQADLANLFTAYMGENQQYIVETHSEHLVLRLRRLVAEGKLNPADVKLFYFAKKGRHTRIHPMDIDERGMVPKWPDGFFEEGYEEAMALAEASFRRSGGSNAEA